MRCLEPAAPSVTVDAREVWQPNEARAHGGEAFGRGRQNHEPESDDLLSPYVEEGVLDLPLGARCARAGIAREHPVPRRLRGAVPGLRGQPEQAGPGHEHEREPDPRWAALSELRFE